MKRLITLTVLAILVYQVRALDPSLDTIEISTAQDLIDLTNAPEDWCLNYILTADIDMAGKPFSPIGYYGAPFCGSFDGNNKKISNIEFVFNDTTGVGFFGFVGDALIHNLGLENIVVITDQERVGLLIGASYISTIFECYVSGAIKGNPGRAGSLVGFLEGSNVANCYSTGTVNGWTTGCLFGNIGRWWSSGDENRISRVFYYGSTTDKPAIAGQVSGTAEILYTYYISSAQEDANGVAKTAEELNNQSTYHQYDFSDVWIMGDSCAVLRGFNDVVTKKEELASTALKIYTNPINNTLRLSESVESLTIYSMKGQLLKSEAYTNSVDISNLSAGVYILTADSEVYKFIKL